MLSDVPNKSTSVKCIKLRLKFMKFLIQWQKRHSSKQSNASFYLLRDVKRSCIHTQHDIYIHQYDIDKVLKTMVARQRISYLWCICNTVYRKGKVWNHMVIPPSFPLDIRTPNHPNEVSTKTKISEIWFIIRSGQSHLIENVKNGRFEWSNWQNRVKMYEQVS